MSIAIDLGRAIAYYLSMTGQQIMKRIVDVYGAIIILIVLSPVLLLSVLLTLMTLGRPIIFCQRRAGKNGRVFNIWKLRTMRESRDRDGRLLPDADRLTAVGKFLRATSMDELPELINVLRGEISLVGPRPLLPEYLPHYSKKHARRHEVLPGITGWAQIKGRNDLTWKERFDLDIWYVDHWSLWLDLRILVSTPWRVLTARGIHARGYATMPPFAGASDE